MANNTKSHLQVRALTEGAVMVAASRGCPTGRVFSCVAYIIRCTAWMFRASCRAGCARCAKRGAKLAKNKQPAACRDSFLDGTRHSGG